MESGSSVHGLGGGVPDVVSELRSVPVGPTTRAEEVTLAWSLEGSAVAVALLASELFDSRVARRALERRARRDALESLLMGARGGVVSLVATRLAAAGRFADSMQDGRIALLSCLRRYDWRIARLDLLADPVVAKVVGRTVRSASRDALGYVVELGEGLASSDGSTAEGCALASLESDECTARLGRITELLTPLEASVLELRLADVERDEEVAGCLGVTEREVVGARLRVAALLRHPGAVARARCA